MIDTEDCWLWAGTLNFGGYGSLYAMGRSFMAHRVTYEDKFGSIPEGLEIDHLCRVRSCINPAHLEAVTHAENRRRSAGLPENYRYGGFCKIGHLLSSDNVYWVKGNTEMGRKRRQCRQCLLDYSKKRYAKRIFLRILKSACTPA